MPRLLSLLLLLIVLLLLLLLSTILLFFFLLLLIIMCIMCIMCIIIIIIMIILSRLFQAREGDDIVGGWKIALSRGAHRPRRYLLFKLMPQRQRSYPEAQTRSRILRAIFRPLISPMSSRLGRLLRGMPACVLVRVHCVTAGISTPHRWS